MQFSGLVNAPLRSDLSQVGGAPKKGKKKRIIPKVVVYALLPVNKG
jgi:hypothetical protein